MKRFSSPAPKTGPSIPFEVEVYRLRKNEAGEPVTAEDGSEVREPEVQQFAAVHDVSGGVAVQLELLGKTGPYGRGSEALFEFLDNALVPADRARFSALVKDPDVFVQIDVLSEVALWLYQMYAGREERPTTEG